MIRRQGDADNIRRRWRLIVFAGIALAFPTLIASLILAFKWPFSKQSVVESMQEIVPSTTVQISQFRSHIFPHPGCEAEGVIVRRSSSASDTPLVTVQRISIQARYADLFMRPGYLARIRLNGLRIHVPAPSASASHKVDSSTQTNRTLPTTRVGEIAADGAVLEIARQRDRPPLKFEIHSLILNSVSGDKPLAYRVALTDAIPPGEIASTGHLGPWNAHNFEKTPVSGSYSFQRANLGVFPGIAGMLSSEGRFDGELDQINFQGAVAIPDFKVKRSSHQVNLRSEYIGTVNAMNGDVFLRRVTTSFLQTAVVASGQIAGRTGQNGKTTSLGIEVREGKIQDVLRLFVRDVRPPLAGVTTFRASIFIPPQGRPFLEEVNLRGDFGIGGGRFTKLRTQTSVNDLSQRARGDGHAERRADDLGNVISDLEGHVQLRNGVARFTNLTFNIPGASADMDGEYNLFNEKIDFHGILKTQAKLSQTTRGLKSALLKPFDRLFKKKDAGAEVPVEMTGTYESPHFGMDLNPTHKRTK